MKEEWETPPEEGEIRTNNGESIVGRGANYDQMDY